MATEGRRPEHPIVEAAKHIGASPWGVTALMAAGLLTSLGFFGVLRTLEYVLCAFAFVAGVVALFRYSDLGLRYRIAGAILWLVVLGSGAYWGQLQYEKGQSEHMQTSVDDGSSKAPWILIGVGLIGVGIIFVAAGVRVKSARAAATAAAGKAHEKAVPAPRSAPPPPQIEFITVRGLIPGSGTHDEKSERFRDHKIFITNVSSLVIYDIELIVHFPEMVKGRLRKLSPEFVDAAGAPQPTEVSDLDAQIDAAKVRSLDFTLEVKELAPQQVVTMVVRSEAPSDIATARQRHIEHAQDPALIPYYVEGWYRYNVDSQGKREHAPTLVPLRFDSETRSVTAAGEWNDSSQGIPHLLASPIIHHLSRFSGTPEDAQKGR